MSLPLAAAPYAAGLLLALAAAMGGLRSAPAWLAFGAVLAAWLALSGRSLRFAGREFALLFFCWLAAAALFSSYPAGSAPALARYALLGLFFFAASAGDARGWGRALTVLGSAAALTFLAQKAAGAPPLGFIGANPNYSAIFAAAAFPGAVLNSADGTGRRRLAFAALAALLAAGIFVSGSRGALGAAFLAGAAGLWLSGRRRTTVLYLLAAGAAAALLPHRLLEEMLKLSDPRAFARPQMWGTALQGAAASPLLGWGPGSFENVFELFKFPHFDGIARYWHTTRHAHGELFNLAAEAGFPAALLFCAAAVSAFFKGGRANLGLKLALLAVFVQGMVDMVFYSGAVSLLFWGTLGALSAGEEAVPGPRRFAGALAAVAVTAALTAAVLMRPTPRGAPPGGYPEAALARVRLAALDSPRNPLPEAAAADLLLAAGDAAGAGEAYRRALLLEPNFIRAHLGLAEVYGRTGRRAEACGELELARGLSGLKGESAYHRELVFPDDKRALRLEKELCGKKRTGGATAPGRKTR